MSKQTSDAAALRRRLLPPGSGRERLARLLAGGVWNRLQQRRAERELLAAGPQPQVLTYQGPAQRLRLPSRARILLLKLDHIGDFVLSLAAFETLRTGFPDAAITLVCGSWARDWAARLGWFDRIVPFDFFPSRIENWHGASPETLQAFDALDLGRFDLAIDLRHDRDTRPLLARAQARFRAGYAAPLDEGGAALDIALPDAERVSPAAGTGLPLHAGQRASQLAAVVVASFAHRSEALAQRLRGGTLPPGLDGAFATLAPGAGTPIKCWKLDRMIAIAAMLESAQGLQVAVVGGAEDRPAGAAIAAALPPGRVRDFTGALPLADLPELLARARLHVGNDTGATHLAAALGTPTLAIMSGLPALEVWHPVGPAALTVAGRARCSPCYKLRAEDCPFDIACLDAVRVEHIAAACRDLLAGAPGLEPAA